MGWTSQYDTYPVKHPDGVSLSCRRSDAGMLQPMLRADASLRRPAVLLVTDSTDDVTGCPAGVSVVGWDVALNVMWCHCIRGP
jgi:hypothetical protein